MLTNLDFLNTGESWPPEEEIDRLEGYKHNKMLFENRQDEVYSEAFKRIERVIGNFQDVVSYPVIINYQKLISLKVADLLLGEPPKIRAGESDSAEQKTVEAIVQNTDLINTAYETAIDVSRYGDGLFYVYKGDEGGVVDVSQPPIWFPVASPDNVKKIQYHVLAWMYQSGKNNYLKVQIHEKGKYTEREYHIESNIIKAQTVADKAIQTGLKDFAVIQVPNVVTSDRVHGIDDYRDVDSIITELLVRVGQIARILDKHAAPSVQGPQTALEKDPATGEWQLKMGNYFPRNSKEDPEVGYITWDGQLAANFQMIDKLVNFLHAISETGDTLLGDKEDKSGVSSGTALRLRMISPLAKVRRIAMRFQPALVKAVKLASQLGGEGIKDLSKEPVSVTFRDGLPDDPKEQAAIMQTRTAGKATLSVKRALKTYDDMDEKTAENELSEITDEEASANPISGAANPFAAQGSSGGE